MKLKLFSVAVILAAVTACSNNVARPGSAIRGTLPPKTHTLVEAWADAGDVLMALGCPMKLDVYTEVHDVSGSGILVIDVRSHDFDPVAAVLDGQGRLLAFNDNWKDSSNARIVLDGVPSGARLLVFSTDDSRGLYDVVVTQGKQDDLDAFMAAGDLNSGEVKGYMGQGGYNPVLENVLRDALQDDVYNYNFGQAQLFPFTLQTDQLVSLSLESDDFDPYLVLVSVQDGSYSFVNYNDDYQGTYSRLVQELQAGNYLAVVMPYSAGGTGNFTLSLEKVDQEMLRQVETPADQPDVEYDAEIVTDRNCAMAWWPDMGESYQVPDFLDPFSPAAAFTFTVDEPGPYSLSAHGDMDVCLTLLKVDGGVQYIDSNDDYADMGTDSRVITPLMPGRYIALVSPYSSSDQGEVSFSWSGQEGEMGSLRPGRSVDGFAGYDTASLMYSFDLQAGRTYTISVESQELDPVITVYLPDGSTLYDDDGGEGTNSLLTFTADDGQSGEGFLIVEKYSEGEGSFHIELD